MEDEAFIGRGRALPKRMRPVITPQAGEDGNADLIMRGLSLIHLRFAGILNFSTKPDKSFVFEDLSLKKNEACMAAHIKHVKKN